MIHIITKELIMSKLLIYIAHREVEASYKRIDYNISLNKFCIKTNTLQSNQDDINIIYTNDINEAIEIYNSIPL